MADEATPAAATSNAAAKFESTDDIVSSLLADPAAKQGAQDEGGNSDAKEEGDDAAEQDAVDDVVGESDDVEHEADDTAPADEELEDAKPIKGKPSAELEKARKALEDGDLDAAFMLAFGKKPEEVQPDAKVWTQWRAAQRKAEQKIATREQATLAKEQQLGGWERNARSEIQKAIEQLRPYDEIHQARVAFQREGDPSQLVRIIELTTGLTYDEAQKAILMKQRRSPAEQRLARELAELRQQLETRQQDEQKQTQTQTQQQVYASDLAIIRSKVASVEGGEILKVPQYAERIYNVLIKTRTPNGLAMTEVEAARRVLAAERRKLATHPLLKKPAPKLTEAAKTLASAKKGKTGDGPPLRRDSQRNGAKDPKAIETTDDIINDLIKGHNPKAVA